MKNYIILAVIAAFFLDVAPMPAPKSCGSQLGKDNKKSELTVTKQKVRYESLTPHSL